MENSGNHYKCRLFILLCPFDNEKPTKTRILPCDMERQRMKLLRPEIVLTRNLMKLAQEIQNYDFTEYASLILFADFRCNHCDINAEPSLEPIFKAMEKNKTLTFVTKFVWKFSIIDKAYVQRHLDIDEYNTETELKPISPIVWDQQANITNINNFTYMQTVLMWLEPSLSTIERIVFDYFIDNMYVNAVQEYAKSFCSEEGHPILIPGGQANYYTTCAGASYVFHVNPSMSFILNHITFPQKDARPESEKDIPTLVRTLMKKKITSYTLIDGSLQDIRKLMQKIRTTDFTWLKYLYIFISSHGDIGDIIHTKTGTYNIHKLIVKNLVANRTLKNVQKFIIVNACRGDIDPRNDDVSEEGLAEIKKKDNDKERIKYFLEEKLLILYSTRKGFVSYLSEGGAIFLQKFSEVFDEMVDETSMETIGQKVIEKVNEYFYNLGIQTPEFGPSTNSDHPIKMEFVNSIISYKPKANMTKFFKKNLKQNPYMLEVSKCTTINADFVGVL